MRPSANTTLSARSVFRPATSDQRQRLLTGNRHRRAVNQTESQNAASRESASTPKQKKRQETTVNQTPPQARPTSNLQPPTSTPVAPPPAVTYKGTPDPITAASRGAPTMAKKVVLAYSGGLDTSVAIRWLQEERGYDVIALTIDLGNEKDLQTVEKRAIRDRRHQGHRPRRQAAVHRLLRLPGADGRRRLRGPVPPRDRHRPPADRQDARRCRARRGRDRHRPRLHRQGQRPGALRCQHAGASTPTSRSSRPCASTA